MRFFTSLRRHYPYRFKGLFLSPATTTNPLQPPEHPRLLPFELYPFVMRRQSIYDQIDHIITGLVFTPQTGLRKLRRIIHPGTI
jgi:hypothetical protein